MRMSMFSRMTRIIKNHGQIGEYYRRFNIPGETQCLCGVHHQTRRHLLSRCPLMIHRNITTAQGQARMPSTGYRLHTFLLRNPSVYTFLPPSLAVRRLRVRVPSGVG